MVAADVIALVVILGFFGLGGKSMLSAWKQAGDRAARRRKQEDARRDDLRAALGSHDYRKLDDFIVLWGDQIDLPTREHIKERRDELFLERVDAEESRRHGNEST
jgi:hypothetical protein